MARLDLEHGEGGDGHEPMVGSVEHSPGSARSWQPDPRVEVMSLDRVGWIQ